MAKQFSISYKKFEGKYLESIKEGIKKEYLKFYNEDDIDIVYNVYYDEYYFDVFVKVPSINIWKENVKKIVKVANYVAHHAAAFSDIPIEKYYEEYDESRKKYLMDVVNEIDSIMMMSIINGDLLKSDYQLTVGKDQLSLRLPKSIRSKSIYINKEWSFTFDDMLTLKEKERMLMLVKEYISKWRKNYIE